MCAQLDYTPFLPDARLGLRLSKLRQDIISSNSIVVHRCCDDRKSCVAAYRFYDNSRICVADLISANEHHCQQQIEPGKHYLVIGDSTNINFHAHAGRLRRQDDDLGSLGKRMDGQVGFILHPNLVLDSQHGYPIGYSRIHLYTRSFVQSTLPKHERAQLPITQKESIKWLDDVQQIKQRLRADANYTYIADRDADLYELFALPRAEQVNLLVRAAQNRRCRMSSETKAMRTKLQAALAQQPTRHTYKLSLARTNNKRRRRTAKVRMRWTEVSIQRPDKLPKSYPDELSLFALEVIESPQTVPSDEKPIRWLLLSTHPIKELQDALNLVKWYAFRWRIEELFSLIKSKGLEIEKSQLTTGLALKKQTIVAMDTALIILQLIKERDHKLGLPLETVLPQKEDQNFMEAIIPQFEGQTKKQKNPYPTQSLARLAWLIGRLGGWKGYQSESPPGPKTMSRGWQRFQNMKSGYEVARNNYKEQ